MRTGRPKQPLNLVLVDKEKLELLARRPKDLDVRADVVFSFGLIEHFDPVGTCQAIQAHFECRRVPVVGEFLL